MAPSGSWAVTLAGVLPVLAAGCAFHRYDAATGTEHLWGFGHLKMRAIPFGDQRVAVVTGAEMWGVNAGLGQKDYHLGVGYNSSTWLRIVDTNASIALIWPSNASSPSGSLFNVRLGTNFPYLPSTPAGVLSPSNQTQTP